MQYSIKDLERLSGIKAHTIRVWEQRYNILSPVRSETNIRFYSDAELKKLLILSTLADQGFKVSKLAQLSDDELKQEILALENHSSTEIVEKIYIDKFIEHTIDFNEQGFDHSFAHCILKFGLENTFVNIMYPLLRKLGFLWGINDIYPAQEHFVSNLIKRKLMVAIDGIYDENVDLSEKWTILYLPEWEQHEIGLLFSYFLLKKRKQRIIYLGANVPYDNIVNVIGNKDVSTLVTFFIAPQSGDFLNEYIAKVEHDFPKIKVLIAGSQNDLLKPKKKSNVSILESPLDLINTKLTE